ncbi:hypothetical protein [Pectobacterium sp. B1J-3]|uniref:hypothetical protein n=1 Tax=Pectobacterium sp. B1J-3 TaxID=3385371 RepID=UPI0039057E84
MRDILSLTEGQPKAGQIRSRRICPSLAAFLKLELFGVDNVTYIVKTYAFFTLFARFGGFLSFLCVTSQSYFPDIHDGGVMVWFVAKTLFFVCVIFK